MIINVFTILFMFVHGLYVHSAKTQTKTAAAIMQNSRDFYFM